MDAEGATAVKLVFDVVVNFLQGGSSDIFKNDVVGLVAVFGIESCREAIMLKERLAHVGHG